jgi:hypothetical protein
MPAPEKLMFKGAGRARFLPTSSARRVRPLHGHHRVSDGREGNPLRRDDTMEHARRDESETPRMETRSFTDEEGRRWAGSVLSGRFAGGEERAEVIFVCEDAPGEAKRFARLDSEPADAAEEWRRMSEDRMKELFRGSEPA